MFRVSSSCSLHRPITLRLTQSGRVPFSERTKNFLRCLITLFAVFFYCDSLFQPLSTLLRHPLQNIPFSISNLNRCGCNFSLYFCRSLSVNALCACHTAHCILLIDNKYSRSLKRFINEFFLHQQSRCAKL